MTPDFREGQIAAFERVLDIVKDRLTNGTLTPGTALELQMLAESIRIEIAKAERVE